MGCDIHLHQEIKIKGKWHHYRHRYVGRNYALFTKMAGVRMRTDSEIKPFALKGIPEDASEITKIHWLRGYDDWHTPSWLSAYEIGDLSDWMTLNRISTHNSDSGRFYAFTDIFSWLFGYGFDEFKDDDCRENYPPEIEDIRFVFWFDN